MPTNESVPLIQHAIQLAIAPVFLLSGIAALLGVMAGRLARIVDRVQNLDQGWAALDETERAAGRAELANLERRRQLATWSINFCTGAALLLCIVIVTLFVGQFLGTDLKWLAGAQFVGVMAGLIGGLSSFVREVNLSGHSGRIDRAKFHQ